MGESLSCFGPRAEASMTGIVASGPALPVRAMVRALRFGCTLRGGERAKVLGNAQEAGTTRELGVVGRAARALQVSFTTANPAKGMRVSEETAE
jgi:hypothetical protein